MSAQIWIFFKIILNMRISMEIKLINNTIAVIKIVNLI